MTNPDLVEAVARALFRCDFADNESETLIAEKWSEWNESRRRCLRMALAVIPLIRNAALDEAVEAIMGEGLHDPQDESDRAYGRAVLDCRGAVNDLKS